MVTSFRMHWGEMDSFSHANNVAYFRWFETGRIEHFRALMANVTNNDEEVFDKEGFISGTVIGPIMASTACRYKAPKTVS